MTSTIKKIDKNKYELTVELGKEELLDYVKLAESQIAKEVKIDGFRKGKVPREKLRQEVGDQTILQEALDIAVQSSLAKALEKEDLEVMQVSNLDVRENSASKLHYKVSVVTFPPTKIGDLTGLKIKKREVVVEKKDIDEALDYIVSSRSKYIAKDKPVGKGDRVEVDFEVTSDGLPVEGGVSKNHPLIVGDNKFIPGFEEQLIGMKPGEERKFSLNAPGDYVHKAIAGRKLDFIVKVGVVQEIDKPALSDDFARGLGNFQNLGELESNVRQGILQEKLSKENQRLRLEILAKISERSKLEIPEDMIGDKLNEMVVNFDNELHAKGMELSLYLSHLNKTQDDLKKDWYPEAQKQVSFALILRKIAKDNMIRVTPEEIEGATEKLVQSAVLRGELDKDSIDLGKIRDMVANDLINEKVFSYLEGQYST